MDRAIEIHKGNVLNDAIRVTAMGEPGPGGAHLRYRVCVPMLNPVEHHITENSIRAATYCDIRFQNGDPNVQINGISNESLLAVLIDRLRGFQRGPFPSPENHQALVCLLSAMDYLQKRTSERVERGVEGQQLQ